MNSIFSPLLPNFTTSIQQIKNKAINAAAKTNEHTASAEAAANIAAANAAAQRANITAQYNQSIAEKKAANAHLVAAQAEINKAKTAKAVQKTIINRANQRDVTVAKYNHQQASINATAAQIGAHTSAAHAAAQRASLAQNQVMSIAEKQAANAHLVAAQAEAKKAEARKASENAYDMLMKSLDKSTMEYKNQKAIEENANIAANKDATMINHYQLAIMQYEMKKIEEAQASIQAALAQSAAHTAAAQAAEKRASIAKNNNNHVMAASEKQVVKTHLSAARVETKSIAQYNQQKQEAIKKYNQSY
jgi:hypothetical protein